ncbi:virulence factor BrkB family protein [Larsenimonas salina]|uniref:virulence factor BrkB family protein n=1 Tax=Larsenimonas salina TaxID=1295565 RepID=UPI002073A555|nr:virulence factor BrkB family protein [Larsenimonas salina]
MRRQRESQRPFMGPKRLRALKEVRHLFTRFARHDGLRTAGALTYTTLFAVVPLTTVLYAMLSAVPAFQGVGDQLQTYVFQQFLPATGEVVIDKLNQFSHQAQQLTGVGIGVLFVTSIMMMYTIEHAFNQIWQVSTHRRGIASFVIYWTVLTLGPLLIGSGFALSSYLASLRIFDTAAFLFGGRDLILMLMPLFLSVLAFFFVYMAVPSTRVRVRDALIGAVSVAVSFELAKYGFSVFVSHFPSYQIIYGAFAAVPLFLIWVYLCWAIVLLGAELTAYLGESHRADWRHWSSFWQSIGLLYKLDKQRALGGELSLRQVRRLVGGHYRSLMAPLVEQRWVVQGIQGGWVLARSLDELPLCDILMHIGWQPSDEYAAPDARFKPIQHALDALTMQRRIATNRALRDYIDEGQSGRPSTDD